LQSAECRMQNGGAAARLSRVRNVHVVIFESLPQERFQGFRFLRSSCLGVALTPGRTFRDG
jgi:hypothetical protein